MGRRLSALDLPVDSFVDIYSDLFKQMAIGIFKAKGSSGIEAQLETPRERDYKYLTAFINSWAVILSRSCVTRLLSSP